MKTFDQHRRDVQQILKDAGFYKGPIDGDIGIQSHAAFNALDVASDERAKEGVHHVKASSFADPADVRAFKKCKAAGGSDQQCFKVGDNGIGLWGDDTTADKPMCALPREVWQDEWGMGNAARGALVEVTANGRTVVCELRDTMPRLENIKNGAGIDLNPAACKALGLRPPIFVSATWKWAGLPA